jgi:AraC-like DNA-binding protein
VQGHFTRIAVADPHETSRLLWENLPPTETALLDEREVRSRRYEALDLRRFRLEPESFGVVLGLPHNHSEGLLRHNANAAPVNVKRAEEFMRASAGVPLTIAEVAAAAGCSVRALQMAFHRFRGTTPIAALQRARLDQARTELLRRGQTASLARIAAEHGFSNPTRFAQLFRRPTASCCRRRCAPGATLRPSSRMESSRRPRQQKR